MQQSELRVSNVTKFIFLIKVNSRVDITMTHDAHSRIASVLLVKCHGFKTVTHTLLKNLFFLF